MNPHGNPAPLAQARARISADKRQRALDAITTLERDNHPVTHTTVARTARVSTWLTYTDPIRPHIQAAQHRQAARAIPTQPATTPAPSTTAAPRTELELARQEIKQLRQDRDQARTAVRHQLGRQLDALSTHDLTARVDELTHHNHQLADQLQQATSHNTALQERVTTLEDDLTAARTSLRRMIRNENLNS
ncbi:FtsZ-binding cell division protein ZapB [Kitasatospora sp. MAP12-15]|uniref:hypothetical protein n=1 Tax=unclassified Kitasatospora TaxID=2633591 RepID=UPI0024768740|nr:hypothetical protein [Kitasatospora sp. MAP12-44]MDH6107787.1 FtsZ-binding cell division protein ZapB [Kitasatospora sp. MAP12-44]